MDSDLFVDLTDDSIEQLIIPLEIRPKRTVQTGALEFAGHPVRLSENKFTHNLNHLKRLLRTGYEVKLAFPVELDKRMYTYIVLYKPE